MEAFFDLIAPLANDLVAFLARYWPSLLVIAAALLLARTGRRAPQFPVPRAPIAYAILFGLALANCALTLAFRGDPTFPEYGDDVGYMLAADTFAHGRLANPPHALPQHFESLYTLQRPAYSAIYFPGNGLALAFGRLIAGRAVIGMQIAMLLAVLAIFWALRGWISEGWAFALGCLVAVYPAMSAWSDSYYSGALPALGGALIAGAAGRLRRAPRTIDGIAFGTGAVLLGWTRPYEGAVVAAAFLVGTGFSLSRRLKPVLTSALAALLLIAAGAGFILLYDARVTGDPLAVPYVVYNQRYLSAPNFIWQRAGAVPRYDHPEFAFLYRQFRNYYFRNRVPAEFLRTMAAETSSILHTAIPSARAAESLWLVELVPFIAFLVAAVRNRQARTIAAVLAAALLSLLSITWFTQPHYCAPSAGAFAIALGFGFMLLDRRWLGQAAFAAMLAAALAGTISSWRPNPISEHTRIERIVTRTPGQHLILVAESCYFHVFNGADIDGQRVIWARDLGNNDELLRRYAGRNVWSFRCDGAVRLLRRPIG